MASLSYPGVYVQEISSGVQPIAVASTSTPAFVGLAEMGPGTPTRVTSWTDFQRKFGTFISDSYLAYSVLQFFNNGGRQCYILRVTRPDAAKAAVAISNRATTTPPTALHVSAKHKGAWGNTVYLQIDDGSTDPGNTFKISVRRGANATSVVSTAPLEVFDNLRMDPGSPNYVSTVLAQNSMLIDAAVDSADTTLQNGVHLGGAAPYLPLGTAVNFLINLDNAGDQLVSLSSSAAVSTATGIATAIQAAVRLLNTQQAAFTGFTCAADSQSRLVLTSGTSSATSAVRVTPAPSHDATSLLQLGTANGGVSQGGSAVQRPALADVRRLIALTGGSDGTLGTITETTFSNAFPLLDNVTDFSLLAVPGESTPAMADLGMAYCANRPLQDLFYIGETGPADDTADDAADFRSRLTTANSYGAVYFPWVNALDPSGVSQQPIPLPPSGFIAGLYARTDAARGVWKAPAGTEASLNGLVGVTADLTDVQHGTLNPIGINVIRRFAGAGIVSFGARTITADAEWHYVPVRRTAIMLRVSIYYGIQWAVFEPNDEDLWSHLRLNIGSFMMTLFRQGAFQGSTATDAFFVKCDGDTTTQADIDAGVVNILVGFAPLKPAEFVVVRISQKAGQASA